MSPGLEVADVFRRHGPAFRATRSEHLDRARQTAELGDEGRIWVNLDPAQHGIGTASSSPGVLPAYRLDVRPMAMTVLLSGPAQG